MDGMIGKPKARKICSVDEIKEKLAPLFREEGLQLVLVFGSMASGKAHEKSDIDLAFLFDKPQDILALTNRVIRLLKSDRVDVVDLRHTSPLLNFIAITKGELLYERSPGVFNSFYSFAFRRYIDTKKLRKMQEIVINSFVGERGIL
jgi:predicted nucleotidyltransferase